MEKDNRGIIQRAFEYLVWKTEKRTLENPQVPLSDATLETLWGYDPEDKPVNLENSLSITAFLRGITLRSDTQASLPFNVIKVDDKGMRSVDKDHPAHWLMNEEFNPLMGAFESRKLLQSHVDTMGNGFAEIIRKNNGDPVELWPIDPKTVKIFFKNRKLYYEIGAEYDQMGNNIKKGRILESDDIFHIHGYSFDGIVGIPPMMLAKDALGIAIAGNSFVNRFYRNNAMPSVVVSVEQRLDKEKKDELQENWADNYGGKNQHKPAILGMGAKVQPITMSLDQAQMSEIMRHSVIEICRMLGVPPHLNFEMERETFTNIETATIGWVRDTVRPNSIEWEQEANRKLLKIRQRKQGSHYFEHDLTSLLRGDSVAMANLFQSLWSVGAINANEIRKQFNWNNIGKEGDYYMVQQGFAPVENIVEKMDADVKQMQEPTPEVVVDKINT